ncbi:MAG: VWA domain-containing protein [Pyrinomonadaceae bacterium]
MKSVLFSTAGIVFLLLIISCQTFGQAKCLTDEEAKKAVEITNSSANVSENPALRQELLDMQAEYHKIEQKITDNFDKNKNLIPAAYELNKKNLLRLCEIVKQNGWVRKEAVGEDGAAAALSFLEGGQDVKLQLEIFPVVAAAAKKGYVGNNFMASLIDSIRVGENLPQIFGTQTKIKDELFYLYPLANDAKVDEWRKLYGLPPLASFMKYLQFQYGIPVIKSPRLPTPPQFKEKSKESAAVNAKTGLPSDLEKDDVVKVESNLVNLNVKVYSNDAAAADFNLQKNDFALFADGKQQEISFSSAAQTPFDLILVLDLSGSTSDKQDLIRKSTRRFIEAARPGDRVAIVTFTDEPRIISDLTSNKDELLKSVKKIKDRGGSGVWLALQFAIDKIVKPESQGRRSAIVMMTDGVDTSLLPKYLVNGISPTYDDSYPNFSDVLETVRNNDTTIIPIYLDTETGNEPEVKRAYREARRTLSMLAEESGGQGYYAEKASDLNGVYEKVINDLGTVYSLGYEPPEVTRDGAWHSLSVKILNHPNLNVRTKTGFYAK